MKRYNCMIVDDHISSQEILKEYISRVPSLKIQNIFNNAIDSLDEIQNNPPQILFLDVEMPLLSGLDFLKTLKTTPPVIITTAHTGYAKDGFDIGIVDFLHKPYSFERFLKAVNRAIGLTQPQEITKSEFIFLKSGIKLIKIFYADIVYVEAYGNYSKLHLKSDKVELITDAISAIEKKLPEDEFLRIHKSYLVAKNLIKSIKNKGVILEKVELPIGETYKNVLNLVK